MSERRSKKLTEYDGLIVDLDGVVWRGNVILYENVDALKKALQSGVKLVFLTNNSTRARYQIAEMLNRIGIDVGYENIVNSAYSAAYWLKNRMDAGIRVGVIGEEGLTAELVMAGLRVYTLDAANIDVVVVGLDRNLTYGKLRHASYHLSKGALYVATNTDRAIPEERTLNPGAGSIVKLLEEATGRKPDFIAGKPSRWIGELALRILRANGNIAVIGDRVETDMELARILGVDGILVLTGAASEEGYYKLSNGVVVRNLGELV